MLQVGIVGLPNVGKSSLFNTLTSAGAPAENYPFCTVDPNIGTVAVPDPRLETIRGLAGSGEAVPAFIRFVDIAGLVKGASEGEGLGNQFLGQIREVDAIAHVLRCFEDPDVTHVMGSVDPKRDLEVVDAELLLADLETLERRIEKVEKKARSGEKDAQKELAILERLHGGLSEGRPVRHQCLDSGEMSLVRELNLLTAKPVFYVANVVEGEKGDTAALDLFPTPGERAPEGRRPPVLPISLALESELALLDAEERREFMDELGMEVEAAIRVIRSAYDLLGLITFFSTNEKQTTAWAISAGTKAPGAAGVIHTDFEKGFIRAEAIGFEEFVELGSMKTARDRGIIRSEGKDYLVKDGDILLFRFNL